MASSSELTCVSGYASVQVVEVDGVDPEDRGQIGVVDALRPGLPRRRSRPRRGRGRRGGGSRWPTARGRRRRRRRPAPTSASSASVRDHALPGEVLAWPGRPVASVPPSTPGARRAGAASRAASPVPDSRKATRRVGWRSRAPSSTRLAMAAICSIGWRQQVPGREAGEAVGADRRAAEAEALVDGEHEARPRRGRRRAGRRRRRRGCGRRGGSGGPARRRGRRRRTRRLGYGAVDVGQRHEPDAEQAPAARRAVVRDPLVVASGRRRPLCAGDELGQERHEQPDRRVEHGDVDALGVHGPEVRRGVEAVLELVGEQVESPHGTIGVSRGQVDRHPLAAPGREHVRRLDHVGVGIEDPPVTEHHILRAARPPSSGSTAPLVYDDASDARNATASHTSRAAPSRPIGTLDVTMRSMPRGRRSTRPSA